MYARKFRPTEDDSDIEISDVVKTDKGVRCFVSSKVGKSSKVSKPKKPDYSQLRSTLTGFYETMKQELDALDHIQLLDNLKELSACKKEENKYAKASKKYMTKCESLIGNICCTIYELYDDIRVFIGIDELTNFDEIDNTIRVTHSKLTEMYFKANVVDDKQFLIEFSESLEILIECCERMHKMMTKYIPKVIGKLETIYTSIITLKKCLARIKKIVGANSKPCPCSQSAKFARSDKTINHIPSIIKTREYASEARKLNEKLLMTLNDVLNEYRYDDVLKPPLVDISSGLHQLDVYLIGIGSKYEEYIRSLDTPKSASTDFPLEDVIALQNEELDRANDEIRELKSKLEIAEDKVRTCDEIKQAIKQADEAIKKHPEFADMLCDDLVSRSHQTVDKMSELQRENARLENINKRLGNTNMKLRCEIDELVDEYDKLQNAPINQPKQSAKSPVSRIRSEVSQLKKDRELTYEEMERMSSRIQPVIKKIADYDKIIECQTAEILELKNQLKIQQTKSDKLSELLHIAEQKEELAMLQGKQAVIRSTQENVLDLQKPYFIGKNVVQIDAENKKDDELMQRMLDKMQDQDTEFVKLDTEKTAESDQPKEKTKTTTESDH